MISPMNGRLYEALWLTQELPDILNLNYYISGSGYLAATIATATTAPHCLADEVWWYRTGSKAALVEHAKWRWVHTIGASPVVCR